MIGPDPLLSRVTPIAGETLMSLVARAAHANVFPKLADLLAYAGIVGHPAFAPFTGVDHAQPLADLLGVPSHETVSRFHGLHFDQRLKDARNWAGIRMRRRSIEAKARRVAPLGLMASPHHRLEWTHRALSFCPETLQQLISSCPRCGAELGWVTTKGLDRCERCEASLLDAPAPIVSTRSPERLRAAARLISPDATVRAAAQAELPQEFQGWDAGDLFAALCELGVAWRRPEEGRGSALARALSDGSYAYEPEDLARGQALVSAWPTRGPELIDKLASKAKSHRTGGRLTAAHLGVLGRHLRPLATEATLGGLLTRAVEAEAAARRIRRQETEAAQATLPTRLVGSIGLVDACVTFGISRPVLSRLNPDGASLIAAQSRRRGGVRFDRGKLADTIIAYQSSESFTNVSQALGVPRYCLLGLIDEGVLRRCKDPDVERLFADRAATAASWAHLRQALEQRPNRISTRSLLNSLGDHLRRRFDPTVWGRALRNVIERPEVRMAGWWSDHVRHQVIDWIYVVGQELYDGLEEDDPKRIDRDVRLTAQEAGRLLGLSSAHLPELFGEHYLPARRNGAVWELKLGDVVDFHARYVTSSEILQRTFAPSESRSMRRQLPDLSVADGFVQTRHFKLCPRQVIEADWEWPDPTLR